MKEENKYTFADLLEDDYFITSTHHPTAESEAYWATLIGKGSVSRDDFELAQYYIRNLAAGNESLTHAEKDDMWTIIYTEGKRKKARTTRRIYMFSAAVACLLALVGLFLFENFITQPTTETIADSIDITQVARPVYDGEDVTIILSDNDHIIVEENNSEIVYNDQGEARVNSNVVKDASSGKEEGGAGKYNQVIVPRGRFTSLVLSDGTKLWLNASSRVVYPPVFEKNRRQIFIEGEAYMEVTPDKNRPFVVTTSRMEVEVLGTSFNISAYEYEDAQSVVLVSGSVSVKALGENPEEVVISPNQLYRLSGGKAETSHVNVNKYISWKEGYFWLESEPMSRVFKRLSNYYGIRIEYDEPVGEISYSGKLDLTKSPDRVLSGLEHTGSIRMEKRESVYYMSYEP